MRAAATRSPDGCLVHLAVRGHISAARGPRGGNALCAAVTGLVRSCVQAISGRPGIVAQGAAQSEGDLEVSIRSVDPAQREWLRGVTDVLIGGLRRMAEDAPDDMEFREHVSSPGSAVENEG